jgi:hypothetical protein
MRMYLISGVNKPVMSEKNHIYLVQQCLIREQRLQVEQSLAIGLRTFASLIQSKSKMSLKHIRVFLLSTMQQNDDNKAIINLCLQMITIVDERLGEIDK